MGVDSTAKALRKKQNIRWLLSCVGASLLPLIMTMMFELVKGSNLTELLKMYLPDGLLVTVSVAASVADLSVSEKFRGKTFAFSIICMFGCAMFYSWLRGSGQDYLLFKQINILTYGAIVTLVTHIFVGSHINLAEE